MIKLLSVRYIVIVAALALLVSGVIAAAFAFLSDSETSTDNTFEAGVLDLQIDNTSYYNGQLNQGTTWLLDDLEGHLFFDFTDVKPGDWGEDTISIHVNDNDAWACFETDATTDDDNTTNELEIEANDTPGTDEDLDDGELGDAINFVFWVDDGDNVLETDENTEANIIAQGTANEVLDTLQVTLADSIENLFTGQAGDPLEGAQTYYIAKAWCFGALGLAPVAEGLGENPTVDGGITCDGSELTNITQTDSFTANVSFSAAQYRSNPNFVCNPTPTPSVSPTPTDTPTPTPTPPTFACTGPTNPVFGASVVSNTQGLRKNGTAVLATRTNPLTGLVPQTTGVPFDPIVTEGTFYALGFPHINNANTPGEITIDMGTTFFDNSGGNDLVVWEVTGGTVYPVETVQAFAKLNIGDSWTSLGVVNRDGGVEIAPLTSARYVRLVEASNIALFEDTADGYDLDGIQALCTQVQ